MKDTRRFVFCVLLSASAGSFFPHRTVAQDQPDQDQICEIRKVGDCGLRAPKALYHPDPEYTDRASKKKISGAVTPDILDFAARVVVTPAHGSPSFLRSSARSDGTGDDRFHVNPRPLAAALRPPASESRPTHR